MQPAHIQELPFRISVETEVVTGDDDGGSAHLRNVSQL
jgi:hypothetical protein